MEYEGSPCISMELDFGRLAGRDPTVVTDQPRNAAVLVPVVEREGDQFLVFIQRSEDLGEHPGQMSFPGGSTEPRDDSLVDTALREAGEEIGLRGEEATVVGRLDDIRTVSQYAVTPFVARVPDRVYDPDGVEATVVAVLPVRALTDDDNYESERRDHPEHGSVVVHYFDVDGYTVWGATARILVDLFEQTTDWRPPTHADPSSETESAD